MSNISVGKPGSFASNTFVTPKPNGSLHLVHETPQIKPSKPSSGMIV